MNKELRLRLARVVNDALKIMVEEGAVTKTVMKLQGTTPSKKNSRKLNFKTRRTYLDPRYQQWYQDAVMQILTAPKELISETVAFCICFYHSTKRRKDPDNGLSSVLDLLVDREVLSDDNWKVLPFILLRNEEANDDWCEIEIYKERKWNLL